MLNDETHVAGEPTTSSTKIEAFIRGLGAEAFPHGNRRSLYKHLLGTGFILRKWSQPDWLCNAGILHSVYGTDRYQRQLLSPSRRQEVRALAGCRVERLVYLFCAVQRRNLYRQIAGIGNIPAEGLCVRRDDEPDSTSEWLSQEEVRSLLILHMANQAEQSEGADGGPGIGLAMISNLGRVVALAGGPVPPIFSGCQIVVPAGDERAAVDAYRSGLALFSTNRPAALHQMSCAAEICPWVGEPAIWLAYFQLQQGNAVVAHGWIERAREALSHWGAAWDKRLSYDEWIWLIDFLAREAVDPLQLGPLRAPDSENLPLFVEGLRKRGWVRVYLGSNISGNELDNPVADRPDPRDGMPLPRFSKYVRSFSRSPVSSNRKIYPGLRATPWHDAEAFPLARALQNEFDEVRREILALDKRQFAHEAEAIPRTGNWQVLFINERGRLNEAVRARCPVTCRIIEPDSSVRKLPGMSYVSRLTPGTHVAAHYAPTNLRLRLHLGIRVPAGNCGIRVDGQSRRWTEGQCLVFDDSLLHEVWNHTAEDRVVLIVDIWHPDLTQQEIALLEGLQGYAMMEGGSLSAYWSKNERARSDEEPGI
jgi:hypothetical protein